MRENAFEFITFEHLSASQLNDLSALSGADRQALIIGLVQEFSRPNTSIPASVWLSFATEFNRKAAPGVGQQALTRLLSSGPAKLASSAEDGPGSLTSILLEIPSTPRPGLSGLPWGRPMRPAVGWPPTASGRR